MVISNKCGLWWYLVNSVCFGSLHVVNHVQTLECMQVPSALLKKSQRASSFLPDWTFGLTPVDVTSNLWALGFVGLGTSSNLIIFVGSRKHLNTLRCSSWNSKQAFSLSNKEISFWLFFYTYMEIYASVKSWKCSVDLQYILNQC